MKSRSLSRRYTVLSIESLETRRLLIASVGWDGPGLGSAQLTYYVGKPSSSLSQSAVDAAIYVALKAWSSVAKVQFTKTARIGLNNSLDFTFKNIDGAGGILGQAYFPKDLNSARIAGDVQFDASENWEVGNTKGRAAFDLTLIAVHEIGHALGLNHSTKAGSVMAATVTTSQRFVALASADIAAIRTLYASKSASVSSSLVSSNAPPSVSTLSRIDNVNVISSDAHVEHETHSEIGGKRVKRSNISTPLAAVNIPPMKSQHVDAVFGDSIESLFGMNQVKGSAPRRSRIS